MAERVNVYIVVEGEPSHPEDAGVPGAYLTRIDSDLATHEQASAALDVFHENVAVTVLDDFTFSLRDEAGRTLAEASEADNYALGHRGVFAGPVAASDLPAKAD